MSRRALLALLTAMATLALSCCAGQSPPDGAAVVNGQLVPTATYQLLVSSAQRRIESSGLQVDWNSQRGRSQLHEIQAQALRLAVRDAVIEHLARERGVTVGDADLDEALDAVERVAGGAEQVDQRLELEGLSRAQYRTLLRDTLLDRELRARDPHYDQHLADALRGAAVQAFVGPCAADHQYPRCVDGR